MSYFPSFGPFYDPVKEQEVYRDNDGSLRVRNRPSGVATSTAPCLETKTGKKGETRIPNQSKIESKWSEHVRPDQGDLFYIDVDGKARARSNSLPPSPPGPSPPHPSHPTLSHLSSDLSRQNGGRHSDSAVVPSSRFLRGNASEEDEEDRVRSRAELRKKSKQLQQALQHTKQDQPKNGEVRRGKKLVKNGDLSSSAHAHKNSPPRMSESQTVENADSSSSRVSAQTVSGNSNTNNRVGASQQDRNDTHFKDVVLVPDLARHGAESTSKLGSGAEVFELLLGIALCRYRQRASPASSVAPGVSGGRGGDVGRESPHGESKECKLVVQGVVAGSPADKSGSVHRGDMLLYLNGQEVTWSNLSSVAHNIRREVRLTFQVPKIIGPTSCSQQGSNVSNGSSRLPAYHNLCLLVTGRDLFSLQQQLLHYPCIALYLTLAGSGHEHATNDDIVYSFPAQEEALTNIRGLFLTLSSSLQDSVQSLADVSTLVTGGQTVSVAYHQQGRDIFIMALPTLRVPQCLLRRVMRDVCRMLTAVFGSVEQAFHAGESCQLDQVFALFFHRLLCQAGADNSSSSGFVGSDLGDLIQSPPAWSQLAIDGEGAAPLLPLSEENRLICDEILSEFEAVDFDDFMDGKELHLRRSFAVLGSCLFFKRYLVVSHVNQSDLRTVYGFLKGHSLLTLASCQPIDELVIWQEIHLRRGSASPSSASSSLCMENRGPVGYTEPVGARWFMMIVGMKHFMLAVLMEAGGCSQEVGGRGGGRGAKRWGPHHPHPLFVDQARATLVQLDTQEVHMSDCCQDRLLEQQDSPLTTSPERFLTHSHSKSAKEDYSTGAKSAASPSRSGSEGPFKYRSSPRNDRRPVTDSHSDAGSETGAMTRQGSKLSYGSNDSAGSGSSTGTSKPKNYRFSSLLDMSSIGRSMSALHIDTIGSPDAQRKLSRGKENVIFHFIHYNDLEGVLVTSADLDLSQAPPRMQSEVMANFHRCVLNLSAVFSESRERCFDSENGSPSAFEGGAVCMQGAQEQGVLFECCASAPPDHSSLKATASLTYWVVGRRFVSGTASHELFVCFHESASQSMVEMAFTLGFGS